MQTLNKSLARCCLGRLTNAIDCNIDYIYRLEYELLKLKYSAWVEAESKLSEGNSEGRKTSRSFNFH